MIYRMEVNEHRMEVYEHLKEVNEHQMVVNGKLDGDEWTMEVIR